MKKHNFALKKWYLLYDAILTKNSKSFWQLVTRYNSPTFSGEQSPITPSDWVSHFSKIFSSSHQSPDSVYTPHNSPIWPPVTKDEVKVLISSLRPGKAPGPDGLLNEFLAQDSSWWSEVLANLFTLIDQSGHIPESWQFTTLVPIHKKGDYSSPSNYRPISLLSSVGKLYAKHLLDKLSAWAKLKALPGKEQIGFRSGSSTLDHALLLAFLAEKYSVCYKGKLFVAFIDLRGAFDSVNRDILWSKLASWGIDPRLLYLIQQLHSSNFCRVRTNRSGSLSDSIPITRGVRQGCVLAPLLFNLFLSDLRASLSHCDKFAPILNGVPLSLLLYADDAVLLSISRPGLRHLLMAFQAYCLANDLVINKEKTKILVFSKSWSPSSWKFGSVSYQQVKTFKYLGISFHHRLTWTTHRKLAISSTSLHLNAVARFHFNCGNQYIPAALWVFQTKILNQLLYGVPIWIEAINKDLDQVASIFFRRILGVPNSIRLATMALELGFHLPSTTAWSLAFKYWLHLHLNSHPDSLLYDLLRDPYKFKWIRLFEAKLQTLDISLESLAGASLNQAHSILKSKLWEVESQFLFSNINPTCSPSYFGLLPSLGHESNYFKELINPNKRRAFMLARFNIFPSVVLTGRFQNVPLDRRICNFCSLEPDTVVHILCRCPALQPLRDSLLGSILPTLSGSPDDLSRSLLEDSSMTITNLVAEYLLAVIGKMSTCVPSSES